MTTNESAPENLKISSVYASSLKARYSKILTTGKTDWPKHKVTQYVRLAFIEKGDIDKNLDEFTRLTLQGDVDKIPKKKKPLSDVRDTFHCENKLCCQLILIMGGLGEY